MDTWICSKFKWDTANIKTKYKKTKRYPDTFGELSLTGVLPSRDSEIRGAIARIANINAVLKGLVNKIFPIENTYQDTNQTGTTRQQNVRQESAVTGKLKRKYEC